MSSPFPPPTPFTALHHNLQHGGNDTVIRDRMVFPLAEPAQSRPLPKCLACVALAFLSFTVTFSYLGAFVLAGGQPNSHTNAPLPSPVLQFQVSLPHSRVWVNDVYVDVNVCMLLPLRWRSLTVGSERASGKMSLLHRTSLEGILPRAFYTFRACCVLQARSCGCQKI